ALVHRRLLMNEREGHEFGEPLGLLLDVAQQVHVLDPVGRGLDVPVHDGRSGGDAEAVGRGDDLDPLLGSDPPRGDDVADLLIAAEVPGRVSSPAALSSRRYWGIGTAARVAPYSTSSGENACRCRSGRAFLTARVRSMYRLPSILGGSPACMHTSVAPMSTASC